MLEYVLFIYFVYSEGTGYIPTQDVKLTDMSCGLPGSVIGVQIDREVNPTKITFTDPGFTQFHCEVDIRNRVIGLTEGQYHIATTVHDDGTLWHNYHDPHTSVLFTRVNGTGNKPNKPINIGVKP